MAGWLREQFGRVIIWNWEIARLPLHAGSPFEIVYIGRKSQRDFAMSLLNTTRTTDKNLTVGCATDRRVMVSEMPFPGALRIPSTLSSVVPLGRPIEVITSNFHSQLRREFTKKRKNYRMQQVLDSTEIERVDREMLRPYANA